MILIIASSIHLFSIDCESFFDCKRIPVKRGKFYFTVVIEKVLDTGSQFFEFTFTLFPILENVIGVDTFNTRLDVDVFLDFVD